ncbi:MAG TPA: ABC transporter substrate-binding protein [Acidobacteriota bacterium]|nr:ABC transporter substrate-binding protein [Acidobacteriota bacterium]
MINKVLILSSFMSLLAFGLILLTSRCGKDQEQTIARPVLPLPDEAKAVDVAGNFGGQLRYALAGEPETFNYVAAIEVRSRTVASLTTAALLEFRPVEQRVEDGLAKSWDFSPDGTELRILLRQGIRFSDGEPLTADDILFTFERLYEKESANVLKDALMVGGEPLQVEKVSDFEIVIRFSKPHGGAEYLLSNIPILPEHLLKDHVKPIEQAWTLDTPPEAMAGLGPFVIAEHFPGRRTVLRYNPHYWKVDSEGRRLPYLDEIVFEYVEDRNTQLLRFKSNELDILDQLLRPDDFQMLVGGVGIHTEDVGPSANLMGFWCNLNEGLNPETNEPFVDPVKSEWFHSREFRQALSCSINRADIVQNVYAGFASVASTLIPPSNRNWHAADVDGFQFDPARARQLLNSAGFAWKGTRGSEVLLDPVGRAVALEILTRTDDVAGRTAAMIQQDLEALGIAVSIRQEEMRAVIGRIMRARDYDTALMNNEFPIEPSDIMNVLSSGGSFHMWNPLQVRPASDWEARIDELMLLQGTLLDRDKRFEAFHEVQEILAWEVPYIPIVNRNILVAWQPHIKNLRAASVFPYGLSEIWAVYLVP